MGVWHHESHPFSETPLIRYTSNQKDKGQVPGKPTKKNEDTEEEVYQGNEINYTLFYAIVPQTPPSPYHLILYFNYTLIHTTLVSGSGVPKTIIFDLLAGRFR